MCRAKLILLKKAAILTTQISLKFVDFFVSKKMNQVSSLLAPFSPDYLPGVIY